MHKLMCIVLSAVVIALCRAIRVVCLHDVSIIAIGVEGADQGEEEPSHHHVAPRMSLPQQPSQLLPTLISTLSASKTRTPSPGPGTTKLPDAQPWMRLDGLGAADWQVVTEYMDILKPLKECTKRLEGRGKQGNFGAISEVIPVFDHLLSVLESRLQTYEDVAYDAHPEAPEDHLAINLRAALVKAREYYNKLDVLPAYYAATILHPRYKFYCDIAWAEHPEWIESSNGNFRALWAAY
jgi:hypothetical protein